LPAVLGALCRRHSRIAAAILFGSATMLVTYFAWIPSARTSVGVIYLSVAAGAAHALAASIIGPSLVNAARTPSGEIAALRGAGVSLLALAFFALGYSGYLFATDGWTITVASLLAFPVSTAFFAFFAAGWALLLVSALIGWGMHKLVA
jgi:hypothetical protein